MNLDNPSVASGVPSTMASSTSNCIANDNAVTGVSGILSATSNARASAAVTTPPADTSVSNGVYLPSGITNGDVKPAISSTPLADFLLQLEDYTPTIPDAVTGYYLNRAGFEASDPRINNQPLLLSFAPLQNTSDLSALQNEGDSFRKLQKQNKGLFSKYTLMMEDLAPALSEYGVNVKKPHYFT
uniref:TAF10 RNA polymerase II, TATA box binding protein (TBP)-associated factor n=1 Tax=Nothobranchius furzeri TaxID=105023 RepID=A0A8C6MIR2_NOTFU